MVIYSQMALLQSIIKKSTIKTVHYPTAVFKYYCARFPIPGYGLLSPAIFGHRSFEKERFLIGSLLPWRKALSTTGTPRARRFCILQPSSHPLFKARSRLFLRFARWLQLLMQSKKNAVSMASLAPLARQA